MAEGLVSDDRFYCMKFLCSTLLLEGLCIDDNDADTDADDYTRQTNQDDIGSFGIIPNEPKTMSGPTKRYEDFYQQWVDLT